MLGRVKDSIRSARPLYRSINRLRGMRIHEPDVRLPDVERLGSDYGGWGVLPRLLASGSIVYSVGVGQDISFDLALIERTGVTIDAFDPTPVSGTWIAGQTLPAAFRFHAIGLAGEDGETRFKAPTVAGHASFSVAGGDDGDAVVICPVRRVETLMRELGHDRLDLLKMDIEGFEYGVIDDLLAGPVRPAQLLIEFHHGMYDHTRDQTETSVAGIRAAGYRLFWVSDVGQEYGFVRSDQVQAKAP